MMLKMSEVILFLMNYCLSGRQEGVVCFKCQKGYHARDPWLTFNLFKPISNHYFALYQIVSFSAM